MDGPQIEYNHDFTHLEKALKAIDRPGDYFTAGRVEGSPPRMSVSGVGLVAFPILDAQVRSLVDASERAPYGRGPDTLVDTTVRDCWQISANRVRLSGTAWTRTLQSILDSVTEGLGWEAGSLRPKLYKLLVYEPGGFFSEHRDTEKVEGMIATLVVSLPTDGRGGNLEIRHSDRTVSVDMQVDDPGELAYAAFYADCVHLTKPIETGHRVSLVYNLVMKPGSRSAILGPPDYARQASEVSRILSEWAGSGQGPTKIVWLLEHEYSQVGLSRSTLKGVDEAVGRTLACAAERSNCVLQSAILSICESGAPEYDDIDEYGREVDYTGHTCSIEEFFDCSYLLHSWSRTDLTGSELPEIPLLDEEALPNGCLENAEPDEQMLFEASGNEGASIERSYRLAALVLWPRSNEVSVIADGNIDAAIKYAERTLARGAAKSEAPLTGAELVSQLIDSWPQEPAVLNWRRLPSLSERSYPSMLRLLARVSDEEQWIRFLRDVLAKQFNGEMSDTLAPLLLKAGPSPLGEFLPAFMSTNIPRCPGPALSLVARLRTAQHARKRPDWEPVFRMAILAAIQALPEALAPTLSEGEPVWMRPTPQTLDSGAVRDLFAVSHGLLPDSEAEALAGVLARCPKEVDPFRTIPTALSELGELVSGFSETPAFAAMWHHSSDCLLERSAAPPEVPKDQRIEAPIRCGCEFCRALRAFCLDPVAKSKGFRAAQHIRAHLEGTVRNLDLDIECRTAKHGRPYTLICEKVPKSYRRRVTVHAEDMRQMQLLVKASPSSDSPEVGPTLARLREALACG